MAKKDEKDQVASQPEEKAPEVPVVNFEDFLKENAIHPGLVASFTYEARQIPGGLDARTSEEWAKAFEAQSNRKYPN